MQRSSKGAGTVGDAGKDRVESRWRDGPPIRGRARIDQSGNYCHRNITRDVTHDQART